MGFLKPQVKIYNRRPNHAGYVLIKTDTKGNEAETTFLRSLEDGKVYVCKYFKEPNPHHGLHIEGTPEIKLAALLGQSFPGPNLVEHITTPNEEATATEPEPEPDVLIFEYCNGGDVQDMRERTGKENVHESLLWQLGMQLLEMVAFMHCGWSRAPGRSADFASWRAVCHGDLGAHNLLLTWPSDDDTDNAPWPLLRLGDWSGAMIFEPSERDEEPGSWMIEQLNDLEGAVNVLDEFKKDNHDETDSEHPINVMARLLEQFRDMSDEDVIACQSMAKVMAEEFIPKGGRVPEARGDAGWAARWARPPPPAPYQVFTKDEIELPKQDDIWEYMNEDQLPDIVGSAT